MGHHDIGGMLEELHPPLPPPRAAVEADRCLEWSADHDVFVYFDNDIKGYAPWDALRLIDRVQTR